MEPAADLKLPRMAPLPDVAAALRALRALVDQKQDELAAAARVARRTLQRYERGEQEADPETLASLVRAAGLDPVVFHQVLVPALRVVLRSLRGDSGGPQEGDPPRDESGVESRDAFAERIGRKLAESARAVIVEHFLDLDRQDEERRAEALRPKAEDRAAVPGLLRRLARRTPEERAFLVEVASPFASWALAERLAHGTAEAGDDDLGRLGASIERTRLAVQIAGQVAGPKSWKDRVLGYTRAFLAQELRAAGDNQAAQEAAAEAERRWEAGLDDEGLLDEGRFRKALGAGAARH